MSTTVYDVKLRYLMDAGNAVKGADRLSERLDKMSGIVSRVGMGIATYFGARAAGRALITFNSTVEDTKNQIAGMFALTKKTNLADEMGNADKMFARLQERANVLPGTTQEYARFASMVTRSVTDAGLGMKDLENITIGAVVAAKAFGEEADVAARDIDQLLGGRFNTTDPFSKKLLGSLGYDSEQGREQIRRMTKEQRASLLVQALGQKQIAQLAEAQGKTFSGRLSTFQDVLQQVLGKVGLPLFEALNEKLERANKWLGDNKKQVEQWAKSVGDGLVVAFNAVVSAFQFIAENKNTLIAVATAWAGVKIFDKVTSIASAVGGLAGNIGTAIGGAGIAGKIAGSSAFGSVVNMGIKLFASPLGQALKLAGALGLAAVAGYTLGKALGEFGKWWYNFNSDAGKAERSVAAWTAQLDASTRAAKRGQTGLLAETPVALKIGGINLLEKERELLDKYVKSNGYDKLAEDRLAEDFGYTRGKLGRIDVKQGQIANIDARIASLRNQAAMLAMPDSQAAFEKIGQALPDAAKEWFTSQGKTWQSETAQLMAEAVASGLTARTAQAAIFGKLLAMTGATLPDNGTQTKPDNADRKAPQITIQRIEVAANDPERFVIAFNNEIERAMRRPSRAKGGL